MILLCGTGLVVRRVIVPAQQTECERRLSAESHNNKSDLMKNIAPLLLLLVIGHGVGSAQTMQELIDDKANA